LVRVAHTFLLSPSSFLLRLSVYIRGDVNGWRFVGFVSSSWRVLHPLYSSREREEEGEEGEDGDGDGEYGGGGRHIPVSGGDAIGRRGRDATWGDGAAAGYAEAATGGGGAV
jgi:hypothetical protein